jgi:hypothetical protein
VDSNKIPVTKILVIRPWFSFGKWYVLIHVIHVKVASAALVLAKLHPLLNAKLLQHALIAPLLVKVTPLKVLAHPVQHARQVLLVRGLKQLHNNKLPTITITGTVGTAVMGMATAWPVWGVWGAWEVWEDTAEIITAVGATDTGWTLDVVAMIMLPVLEAAIVMMGAIAASHSNASGYDVNVGKSYGRSARKS